MRPKKSPDPLLIAIMLFAALLRLVGLFRFPFEQDELYTAIEARLLFASPLHPGIQARPLYYLLQHPLLSLSPVTEPSLRALPFLFGLLGVWATWGMTKKLFGRGPAAAAAILVAVSPWHLEATGMARYWSLVYLMGALFPWLLLTAYEEDTPKAYLKVLAVLLVGLATHPTFAFAAGGVSVGITIVKRDGRFGWRWPSRAGWLYLWIPAALTLAVAVTVLRLTGSQGEIRNWGGRGMPALLRLIPAMVQLATPTIVTAGLLGALMLMLQTRETEWRRFGTIALTGIAFQVSLLFAAAFRTDVYAGYAVAALPLGYVSIGGLLALAEGALTRYKGVALSIAVLILVAAVSPSTASYLSDGSRFDYRPAFREIASVAPDLAVLTSPIVIQRHYAPELRGIELLPKRDYLEEHLQKERRLWAVVSFRRYGIVGDASGSIDGFLTEHCRRQASYERTRLDYRVYRVELYLCTAS